MEIHEFISSVFKPGYSLDEQQRMIDAIAAVVREQPGFLAREAFYSQADGRWFTHITWESEEAVEASAGMARDPEMSKLYDTFDVEAMMYGRYERREPADLS